MRQSVLGFGVALFVAACSAGPVFGQPRDWLLRSDERKATIEVSDDGGSLTLSNGLIRRVWRLRPNAATVAFDDLMTGVSLLRGVKPEARLELDGKKYDVGGLVGQPNYAYLAAAWIPTLRADPSAFQFVGHSVSPPEARFAWKRVRHHAAGATWPPAGRVLTLRFRSPAGASSPLEVGVHYLLYDGIPALSKWVTVTNRGQASVTLDRFTAEILAVVEYSNSVANPKQAPAAPPASLHVETDYAFGGGKVRTTAYHTVRWQSDPQYRTQVNWRRTEPCQLEVAPPIGPAQRIEPGATFESFRVFELVHDSTDRERRGLALRRMYRTVAPWVTENPLILHVVSTDEKIVKRAIDQCADCGFEMVSLSFGSGLHMESEDPAYHARVERLVEYAASKGIHLGGYSLLSSRRVKPDTDNIVNPATGKPGGQTHGFCPALASEWGQAYFRKLRAFFAETGFLQFTHDGSYPGDVDAAARPPLQRGADDSQWVQWRIITDFYKWLRARGVYLRVPDYYYLAGSNECGMGYREVNWSLPRAQQVIHTRQNIYDGTWEKTPSMGWMFVPLTQYHGGGAAATVEPLDEHLDHYERMLASNLGMGVQAVYRGHRLYDTERTKAAVTRWVAWYKRYREILEADVVHGRRADGRDLDWVLHVDPGRKPCGMLVVYNPLTQSVSKTLHVNLYYTGLTEVARMRHEGGDAKPIRLARDYSIDVPVTVPAGGMAWVVIE